MVIWKDVCKPKKLGGLDNRDNYTWNQITVGKIAWHIHMMKDSLWVRWVHGIILKQVVGSCIMLSLLLVGQ